MIRCDTSLMTVKVFEMYGAQLVAFALQGSQMVGNDQFDFALFGEVFHLLDVVGDSAKPIAAMNHINFSRDVGQRESPVNGGISTSRDDNAAVAKYVLLLHKIMD